MTQQFYNTLYSPKQKAIKPGNSHGLQHSTQENRQLLLACTSEKFSIPTYHGEIIEEAASPEKLTDLGRLYPTAAIYQLNQELVSDQGGDLSLASQAFRRYMNASLSTWQRTLANGGSAPDLTERDYFEVLKCPGNYLIEVALTADYEDNLKTVGLAYALLALQRDGIPDLDKFPEYLFKDSTVGRLREVLAFNTESGFHFPRGQLADMLFDKINEVMREHGVKQLLTRIMLKPKKYANICSALAMTKRGFRYTKNDISFTATLPAIEGIRNHEESFVIKDGIFLYEIDKPTPRQRYVSQKRKGEKWYIYEQIAVGQSLPGPGCCVAIFSPSFKENQDYAFAEQQSGNAVMAVQLGSPEQMPRRSNLKMVNGSANGGVFGPNSLDGILSLNGLRFAAQFGRHDSWNDNIAEYLENMVAQLRLYGRCALKEIILPDESWQGPCQIEINLTDARLLERYAAEAYGNQGIPLRLIERNSTTVRYELTGSEALKFALCIKPYPQDFQIEKDVPAPCLTLKQLMALLARFGMRIDRAQPLFTRYVQDTFLSNVKFFDYQNNQQLQTPPNQSLLLAQKVPDSFGVVFEEREPESNHSDFLSYRYFCRGKKEIRQLVSRRNKDVIQLFACFEINGDTHVLIREGQPRPIQNSMYIVSELDNRPRDFSLFGAISAGYCTEAVVMVPSDEDLCSSIREGFQKGLHIPVQALPAANQTLLNKLSTTQVFPAASAIDESSRRITIEIEPFFSYQTTDSSSGFGSPSTIRSVALNKIISNGFPASPALLDFAYSELLSRRAKIPRWNGPPVSLSNQTSTELVVYRNVNLHHNGKAVTEPEWQMLEEAPIDFTPFYETRQGDFYERNHLKQIVPNHKLRTEKVWLQYATTSLESELTNNTVILVPCAKIDGKNIVLLETRTDLPLIEDIGYALPEVIPAYRIKRDVDSLDPYLVVTDVCQRLENETGVKILRNRAQQPLMLAPLAPEMLVAAGTSIERSSIWLIEIDAATIPNSTLRAYDLADLANNIDAHFCQHSRNGVFTAAHACGEFA